MSRQHRFGCSYEEPGVAGRSSACNSLKVSLLSVIVKKVISSGFLVELITLDVAPVFEP